MYNSQLLIIGNGFDLYCGLKSTFSNYFDPKYNATMNNDLSHFNEFIDVMNAHDGPYLYGVNIDLIKSNKLMPPDLSKFSKNDYLGNLTFWVCFLLLRKIDNPKWSDVEHEIQLFLTPSINKETTSIHDIIKTASYVKDHWSDLKSLDDSPNKTVQIIWFLLHTCFGLTNERICSETEILRFLNGQLILFESRFQEYMNSIIDTDYKIKSSNLARTLADNKNFNLLNFNYTTFACENCLFSRNIHGTLNRNSHPIIGIDSSVITSRSLLYKFTKTYRIMSTSSAKHQDILTHTTTKVIFFGHSLSEADYSYFQSIFDYFDIYHTPISLVFKYSQFDNQEEIRQFSRVSRLLERYGETLDNKDHGKNLMHKLMLEDRLFITDIAHDEH